MNNFLIARVSLFVEPLPILPVNENIFLSDSYNVTRPIGLIAKADDALKLNGHLIAFVGNLNKLTPITKIKHLPESERKTFFNTETLSTKWVVYFFDESPGMRYNVLVEYDENSSPRIMGIHGKPASFTKIMKVHGQPESLTHEIELMCYRDAVYYTFSIDVEKNKMREYYKTCPICSTKLQFLFCPPGVLPEEYSDLNPTKKILKIALLAFAIFSFLFAISIFFSIQSIIMQIPLGASFIIFILAGSVGVYELWYTKKLIKGASIGIAQESGRHCLGSNFPKIDIRDFALTKMINA